MSRVIPFSRKRPKTIDVHRGTVTVCVLRLDGKRMTRAMFRQIPVVKLESWPDRYSVLGWVNDDRGPWAIWSRDGQLVRSDIHGWGRAGADGRREPVTDYLRQVYLI